MPTRTTPWPVGTPCWADHHVPDLERARSFYGAVLGWRIDDPDTDAGNFAAARRDDRPVAGFLVAVEGATPEWHLYFATDDVRATAEAIDRHGGTGLFGPQDVPPDRGTFQLAADPTGATFGVWQAGSLTGTGVYGEHGALGWEDLRSTAPATAQSFYADVFGVRMEPLPEAGPDYGLFHLPGPDGPPLGGIGGLAGTDRSHWLCYFVVDDVDAATEAATTEGGRVVEPARDTPYGRMGMVADCFGAIFAVITPNGPTPER